MIVNGVPIDNPYYYYTTYYYASYYHRPIASGDNMYPDRKRKQVDIDLPAPRDKDRGADRKVDDSQLD